MDEKNVKKTISQHSLDINKDEILDLPRSISQINWKRNYNKTTFSENRLKDPFITAHIKYFNSKYFHESCNDPIHYKRAIESIVSVLEENNFSFTPYNIFGYLLAYLKKKFSSEFTIYKVYTYAKTVSLRFSLGDTSRAVKKNKHLLELVKYEIDEAIILREAYKQAPKLNPPKFESHPDLVSRFEFHCDGVELLKSLRIFCIFYLNEWNKIRNYIYENHSEDVKELLSYSNKSERLLSSENNRKQVGVSGRNLPNIAFGIIKNVNNPILNEILSSSYLLAFSIGPCKLNKSSKMIQDSYCHETLTSTADKTDWIYQINKQFKKISTGKLATVSWAYKWLRQNKDLSLSKNFSIKPDWSGSLQSILSIRDLLGVTLCEEICMAWLLASDRHQPSNLVRLTIEDLAETDNSVSTIINPFSYKARNRTSAGTTYSSPVGALYKKNSGIFEAISGYKSNLIRAFDNGILNDLVKDDNKYIFNMLRRPEYSEHSSCFRSRFLTFSKSVFANYSLKLCAMNGSVSNKYILGNESNSELFLKMIKHAYLSSPNEINLNLSVSINSIARQAVNNANYENYSPTAIFVSDNFDIEITSHKAEDKMELEAAGQNHSLKTKFETYADKLPPYLVKKANFSARVGDEIVNLALTMKSSSEVMTLNELRKTLGISTTAEKEKDSINQDINDLMSSVSLQEHVLDDTGFINSNSGKTIILRHPITIALIKGKIKVIDSEIRKLNNHNEGLFNKMAARRMFLMLLLEEFFSPSEIKNSDDMYANIEFPFSDIIV